MKPAENFEKLSNLVRSCDCGESNVMSKGELVPYTYILFIISINIYIYISLHALFCTGRLKVASD